MSITYLGRPGNYGLSGKRWRYIHYDNGDYELYDIESDPYEWTNLATKPEHSEHIARLKRHVPASFEEYIKPSVESLPNLKWYSAKNSQAPASKPDGDKIDVVFHNQSGQPAKVFWMDRQGEPKPYGTLETGWRKPYSTRPGAVWMITDTMDTPLGHFVVGDRGAQAIIPSQ